MKPVHFASRATLPLRPLDIAEQILDLTKWPEFHGYGPLPGIKSAVFDRRTAESVGTRIRVTNSDGSTHIEEIIEWEPERRIVLHMNEFSRPLSALATAFIETWEFAPVSNETHVIRSFELRATSRATRPLLWLISKLLKRAIDRHLAQLCAASRNHVSRSLPDSHASRQI